MSVAALDRPPPLEGLRSALAQVARAPLWSLGSEELLDLVEEAAAVIAATQAVLMHAVREADAREAFVAEGATSSAAWLRARLRLAPSGAASYVRTGRALA